jgi:hypothetical protein
MIEDDAKIKMIAWRYDFAWKVRDIAQETNDRLDTKAVNIINFSSLLIPIITGILLLYFEKGSSFNSTFRCFWFVSLILLLLSILFALLVIWLADQGMIKASSHFDKCKEDTINIILEKTADDITEWQNKILKAKKNKTLCFYLSSCSFIIALATIVLSTLFFVF